MAVTRRQMNKLLSDLEKPVRDAFERAIRAARSRASISALERAIESGDIDRILAASGTRQGMWSALSEAIRNAYVQAGIFTIAGNIPKRYGMEFDLHTPRVESWLRNRSSHWITALEAEQRGAVQVILAHGASKGANPRTVALDIVGRMSQATGRRQGGVLGLTQQQARYVTNVADDLENLNPRYFSRKLRDRRFDKAVRDSFDANRPLSAAMRSRIVGRYEDRMLKHRGDTIGRTEALAALNAGADESLRQAVDQGVASAVTRIWRHSFSKNERPGHLAMTGSEAGVDEYFTNPITGATLLYPGDGPASEVINCFVAETPISVDRLKSAIRRQYVGDVIKLSGGAGVNLTVTPNHPVLTNRGWVAARNLKEGDHLVYCESADLMLGPEPDVTNRKTTAEQLYNSTEIIGRSNRVGGASVDLHGETTTENIDVVTVDSRLRNAINSPLAKFCRHFNLSDTDIEKGLSLISRLEIAGAFSNTSTPDGGVGCGNSSQPILTGGKCSTHDIALGLRRFSNPKIGQARVDSAASDTEFFSDSVHRVSLLDQILDVGQKRQACSTMALRNYLTSIVGVLCNRRRLFTQIVKAALNNLYAYSQLISDALNRQVRKFINVFKVSLTFFGPWAFEFARDSSVDTHFDEPVPDHAARETGSGTDSLNSFSRDVQGLKFVELLAIDVNHYEGPVFNFETESGLILASSIVTHNCRCFVEHKVDFIAVERAA